MSRSSSALRRPSAWVATSTPAAPRPASTGSSRILWRSLSCMTGESRAWTRRPTAGGGAGRRRVLPDGDGLHAGAELGAGRDVADGARVGADEGEHVGVGALLRRRDVLAGEDLLL